MSPTRLPGARATRRPSYRRGDHHARPAVAIGHVSGLPDRRGLRPRRVLVNGPTEDEVEEKDAGLCRASRLSDPGGPSVWVDHRVRPSDGELIGPEVENPVKTGVAPTAEIRGDWPEQGFEQKLRLSERPLRAVTELSPSEAVGRGGGHFGR